MSVGGAISSGRFADLNPSLVEVITQNQGNQMWQISAIKPYKQFSNMYDKKAHHFLGLEKLGG